MIARSGWHTKYWDVIDQLYWWPPYLGLKSIGQQHWKVDADRVSIPRSMVNRSGPLYTRGKPIQTLIEDLHGKEEILNHVFDLTFAIAPDALIETCFLQPLGFSDIGPFASLGREVQTRYGLGEQNVTQQDGLFVSERSAVGVELKLGSTSWPGQVAKYAALLACEEAATGRKDQLGLLFIAPETARTGHWKKCGLETARIDAGFLDTDWKPELPKLIQTLFAEERDRIADVLDRLELGFISWAELRKTVDDFRADLVPTTPGDQTLQRLIDGFLAQLDAHRLTGLTHPATDPS